MLQIGTAVAVVAITALQLANVDNWKDLWNSKLCKASADPTNSSVCTYIYAVGAVSIALTIIIGLMQVGSVGLVWMSESEGLVGAAATATLPRGACQAGAISHALQLPGSSQNAGAGCLVAALQPSQLTGLHRSCPRVTGFQHCQPGTALYASTGWHVLVQASKCLESSVCTCSDVQGR